MKRKTTITSGNVKSGEKYQLALRAKGKKIEAFIDGQSVAVYKDDKPEYFGRIKLFSAWEKRAVPGSEKAVRQQKMRLPG